MSVFSRGRTRALAGACLGLGLCLRAGAAPPEHGLGLAADAPASVAVLGEVGKPGLIPLQTGQRLKDALIAGGGLTAGADLHHILVRRLGESQMAQVDGEKLLAEDPLADAPLQAGDTVIVPHNGGSLYYAVLGEVSRPVIDLYQGPLTVKSAVDSVLTRDSDKGQIVVVQGLLTDPTTAKTLTVKYDDAAGAALGPGDVVLLARRGGGGGGGLPNWLKKALNVIAVRFLAARGAPPLKAPAPNAQEKVAVVGEVFNPRLYFYGPGMTVRDALEQAAGLTPRADAAHIVLRRIQGGERLLTLDAVKALAGGAAQNPVLQPGDTLYVPRLAQSDAYAVFGAVKRPTVAALGPHDAPTVRAALDSVGLDQADQDRIVLVRGLLSDPTTARVETVTYDQAATQTLAAGDVALAPRRNAAWGDKVEQVISLLKQKVVQYLNVINNPPGPLGASRPR